MGSANEATEIADRLLGTLENPFAIGGHTFRVTASIGVAVADGSTADPEALMRDADHAMIQAKRDGRERAVRLRVSTCVPARAWARPSSCEKRTKQGQFRLVYQPVVSSFDGTTVGRRSPAAVGPPCTSASYPPDDFIPQLEESGPHRRGRHVGAARGVPAGIGVDARLP